MTISLRTITDFFNRFSSSDHLNLSTDQLIRKEVLSMPFLQFVSEVFIPYLYLQKKTVSFQEPSIPKNISKLFEKLG